MKKWQSEDEIKAELRDLTAEARKVRSALEGFVKEAPGSRHERRYLHRESNVKPTAGARDGVQRKKDG